MSGWEKLGSKVITYAVSGSLELSNQQQNAVNVEEVVVVYK